MSPWIIASHCHRLQQCDCAMNKKCRTGCANWSARAGMRAPRLGKQRKCDCRNDRQLAELTTRQELSMLITGFSERSIQANPTCRLISLRARYAKASAPPPKRNPRACANMTTESGRRRKCGRRSAPNARDLVRRGNDPFTAPGLHIQPRRSASRLRCRQNGPLADYWRNTMKVLCIR